MSLWSYLPQEHTARPAVRLAAVEAWDQRDRLFRAVYASGIRGFTISEHGQPEAVTGCRVSIGLFDGLGVRSSAVSSWPKIL